MKQFSTVFEFADEDENLIDEFLRQIKQWTRRKWRLRYMFTDDSSIEQRAIDLAFRDLEAKKMKISHFLCRTHSERTLNRKLSESTCLAVKKHLYDAFYFRKTQMRCDDNINKALKAAPLDKRFYIEREWVATKSQWAVYARQHSCLLLQIMTTNAVELWHSSIKHHANDAFHLRDLYYIEASVCILISMINKAEFIKFSLNKTANHVIRVNDQRKKQADQSKTSFRIIMTLECQECSSLRKFLYSVQKLMIDQWRLAVKNLAENDEPADELLNEMICFADCLFWQQYQLPCRHLWHYQIVFDSFQQSNWNKWAKMFENSDFEVYKVAAKLDVDDYEKIERSNRHNLQMKEILDNIKEKFYELMKHIVEWSVEKRDFSIKKWLDWLQKLTESIRSWEIEEVLQKIQNEKRKRQRNDDDDDDDDE